MDIEEEDELDDDSIDEVVIQKEVEILRGEENEPWPSIRVPLTFDENAVINTHIKKDQSFTRKEFENLIFLLPQYSAFLCYPNLQNSHKFDLKRVAHHKLLRALQHCKKLQKKIQNYRNPNKKTHKKESITKNSHFFSKMYPPIGRKKNLRRAWSACAQWQGVRVRRALYIKNHTVEKEREKKRKLDLRIFLSWHLLFFSG